MQEITIFDINNNSVNSLVQWDKNVKVFVQEDEIDKAYKVHFFNQNNIDEAMVVESTYQDNTLSATVPNDLLSEPYPITGYIFIDKNNEQKSVYCFRIMVRKRPRPADYVYSDQKEYITFKQVLDEAKEFAKSANDYSVLSRSYAIGDTSLRENEELDSAKGYYEQAKVSAINAKESENNAQASQDATSKSEENAASSANEAEMFHLQAKSYAVGTEGEVRPTDIFDNAKSYSELAQQLVDEAQKLLEQAQRIVAAATAGAIIPDGTITFEELPTEPRIGYMYNISNDFTTDERFVDGSGIFYRAGTNVYWARTEKWDIMVGIQVTGIKGGAENNYRVGNVNITAENIGLGNVPNVTTNDQTPTFEPAEIRENISSGNKLSEIFGKITKFFADLKTVAFTANYTDLVNLPTKLSEFENDTGYKNSWRGIQDNLNSQSTVDSLSAKQGKILNDTKFPKTSVINNLLATVAGFALDATQGKILNDKITELNKNINVQLSIKNVNTDGHNPSINMTKYGRVVILTFYDIRYINKPEGAGMIIAEGLPIPLGQRSITSVLVPTYSGSAGIRVGVNHEGKLVYWWVSPDVKPSVPCSGQLVYLTND